MATSRSLHGIPIRVSPSLRPDQVILLPKLDIRIPEPAWVHLSAGAPREEDLESLYKAVLRAMEGGRILVLTGIGEE